MLNFCLRLTVFVVGPFCYALLNILSQLARDSDGTYAFSMPSVVLLAELIKLGLSLVFLSHELGCAHKQGALLEVIQCIASKPHRWLLFSVPSVLYAVNNNLDMVINMYMDSATASVMMQMKILTTAIAWRCVFKSTLGFRKWMSLVLLFCGCTLAALPNEQEDGKDSSTMYIEPFGIVLVVVYASISAAAGVYNEWLYKTIGSDESIHTSNIRIYTVGFAFCLSGHIGSGKGNPLHGGLTAGYNVYTWGLVATYSLMGLILAQVMKHFDNIVKLFVSGSSMYASALLTVIIFERYPSTLFALSLACLTVAQVGYNWEKVPARS